MAWISCSQSWTIMSRKPQKCFEENAFKLNAGDFSTRSKAKAKPQQRDSASSSTRTILTGERTWNDVEPGKHSFCQFIHKNCTYWRENLDWCWTRKTFVLRLSSVEEIGPSSSWSSTWRRRWSYWILENKRLSSGSFCVLSLVVWGKVEEQHGRRRRKQEKISVLYWFFRSNSVPPSSPRSFRTQSHWSFITRQCRDLDGFFQYIYHVGCAINLHSIINSGLIPEGQNLSNKQTFFLPVEPMDKEHKDPDTIDLSVPRRAQYLHKAWKRH